MKFRYITFLSKEELREYDAVIDYYISDGMYNVVYVNSNNAEIKLNKLNECIRKESFPVSSILRITEI